MGNGEVTPPNPEVLAAIESALAEPGTLKKVLGFARKRVFLLKRLGVDLGLEADDWVQEAVLDTISGRLTWDPDRVALSTHLCGAISGRTAKVIQRRKPAATEEKMDEAVAKGVLGDPNPLAAVVEFKDVVDKVKDYLFRAANEKGDEAVQMLLMAYEEGIEGRSAIADAIGVPPSDVTNVRKKLDRLIRDMPSELVEGAKRKMN